MKLQWFLHGNPVYQSSSPLYFDFSHTELSAASFTTLAQGGFGNGALEVKNPSEHLIQDAIDNWLMKRVVALDASGYIAYEGYVAEIEAAMGFHSFIRSMDEFANRVHVDYKGVGSPCPRGTPCKLYVLVEESSLGISTTQTTYGIKEKFVDISGQGKRTSAFATAAGTNVLKTAIRSREFDFELGAGQEPKPNSLRLTLWGYYTTLQWRKTKYNVNTATEIATVVKNILSVHDNVNSVSETVNPFINNDQSQVETTNNTTVLNKERKPTYVQDLIQSAILGGDNNAKQLFFQIWENRMPYLTARPNSPRYFSRYDDKRFWGNNGQILQPYQIRAGAFVVSENVNESLDLLTDTYQRERTSYLDRTVYNDIDETVSLPPSNTLATAERMLARAHRRQAKYIV